VVEGGSLRFYETFDLKKDAAVHEKEVLPLRDARVHTVNLPGRKFCFVVTKLKMPDLVLEAETDALRKGEGLGGGGANRVHDRKHDLPSLSDDVFCRSVIGSMKAT
jgi:hypothetical protein